MLRKKYSTACTLVMTGTFLLSTVGNVHTVCHALEYQRGAV